MSSNGFLGFNGLVLNLCCGLVHLRCVKIRGWVSTVLVQAMMFLHSFSRVVSLSDDHLVEKSFRRFFSQRGLALWSKSWSVPCACSQRRFQRYSFQRPEISRFLNISQIFCVPSASCDSAWTGFSWSEHRGGFCAASKDFGLSSTVLENK